MYNTYGVDLLTTHITQGRLTPTLGYQRYNAYSVANSIDTKFVSMIWK